MNSARIQRVRQNSSGIIAIMNYARIQIMLEFKGLGKILMELLQFGFSVNSKSFAKFIWNDGKIEFFWNSKCSRVRYNC